jgi:hypothetical protein
LPPVAQELFKALVGLMPCDPPQGVVGLLEALIRNIFGIFWNLFEASLRIFHIYSTYFSKYMPKLYDIYSNYILDVSKIYVE